MKIKKQIIKQYHNDILVREYKSLMDIQRKTGFLHQSLSYAIRKNNGYYGGFTWKRFIIEGEEPESYIVSYKRLKKELSKYLSDELIEEIITNLKK